MPSEFKSLLLAGCFTFALWGCSHVEEMPFERQSDQAIRFSASTSWRNALDTRTEYSGEDEAGKLITSGSRFERIDWSPEKDIIRVLCAQAEGVPDYRVTAVTASGGKSSAEVKSLADANAGQKPLQWGDEDVNHYFYAAFPAPGTVSPYVGSTASDEEVITLLGGTRAKVQGTIPASQPAVLAEGTRICKPDMNFSFMYAMAKKKPSGGGEVTLSFTPLTTAFEFTLKAMDEEASLVDLKTLTLRSSSTALAGSFTATLDLDAAASDKVTVASSGTLGDAVTVTLPAGTRLSDDPLTVTVLALPVMQTDLTLELVFDGGLRRSLALKNGGVPISVPAGKKVYVRNVEVPGSMDIFVLDHDGETVTLPDAASTRAQVLSKWGVSAGAAAPDAPYVSYKQTIGTSDKTPVSVDVLQWAEADDDGNPVLDATGNIQWQDWDPSAMPSLLSGVTFSTGSRPEAGALSAAVTENSAPKVHHTVLEQLEHARNLKSRAPVTDLDLSLYDVTDLGTPRKSGLPTTANCYVVDRPGTYRFPVVYGNAIDYMRVRSNGWNEGAYHKTENVFSADWEYLQRYDGGPITSPYVLDDLGLTPSDVDVVVLWEDVPGAEQSMLTVNSSVIEHVSSGFYDPSSGGFKGAVPYISFEVPVGSIDEDERLPVTQRITGIREGNALIALRNRNATDPETGMPVILWSWHIWITDGYDADQDGKGDGLAPVGFVAPDENGLETVVPLCPSNLGWCSADTLSIYCGRTVFLRVAQEDARSGAEPIVFKVTQTTPYSRTFYSGSTLYQWGRKDPFVPNVRLRRGAYYNYHVKEAYSPTGYPVFDTREESVYISNSSQLGQLLQSLGISWNYESNASHAIQHPNNSYSFAVTGPGLGRISYYDNPEASRWYFAGWIPPEYELSLNSSSYSGRRDRLKIPPYLWNSRAKFESNDYYAPVSDASYHVSKMVYDPCPPGFCVSGYLNFRDRTIAGRKLQIDMNNDGAINNIDSDYCGAYYSSYDGQDLIYIPVAAGSIGLRNPYFFTARWIGEEFYAGHGYNTGETDEVDSATRLSRAVRPMAELNYFSSVTDAESGGIDGQRYDLSGTQWE